MPTTSNFGWTTPADTDLVKDGAAAIRTLGNGIDTSLVDLKGGTTGQVLAKASNTDLDFTWSSVDPLTILDAKGDLITATAADTPARLAVGTNGQYLQADSTTSTGLKWATVSAGGMTELASGSLSGASVVISNISANYKNLQLIIRNPRPATDGARVAVRFNGNTGSVYNDGTYVNSDFNYSTGAATSIIVAGSASGLDNTNSSGIIYADIIDYANSNTWKIAQFRSLTNDSNDPTIVGHLRLTNGLFWDTTAISSITLFPNTGNWTAGTYILYGVN